MTDLNPPPEAQRFGRSQTPESPRPVHIPEPSTIPVLLNQMDPVFNDTETYNIPHNQTFSPYSDSVRAMNDPNPDEQDAVQNFLRGAEEENARLENPFQNTNGQTTQNESTIESTLFSALANTSAYPQSSEPHENASQAASSQTQTAPQNPNNASSATESNANAGTSNSVFQSGAQSSFEPESGVKPNPPSNEGGVDYQSLLDTISQSASTAPAADSVSAPTTALSPSQGAQSLPPIPGLPPKPPAQENASEYSNLYPFPNSRNDQQEQYEPVHQDAVKANGTETSPFNSTQLLLQTVPTQAPGIWNRPNSQVSPTNPDPTSPTQNLQSPDSSRSIEPSERPWTPKTQSLYDQFLDAERRYVTEGIWDKFPQGSRLFVGNLPSEKVTKRDLFHTFHRHGRLAQISIKQAYGFVQYLEASSCQAALQAEQGVEIRGRKIHLEVSKPQKNTRSQGQGNKRRRSRSPDRGNSRQNDRHGRQNFSDFREERGRRDDLRLVRSPSPRSYRSRDDYRPGSQNPRFVSEGRPRSPYPASYPPALPAGFDEEATLPLPRRDPRDIPDVQLLILEPSVAQSFINWIEQGFRSKGLRASTIWLSPRLPLNSVVKRQIIEGVQAVVKLTQAAQYNSKIPLQVFDRSTGASNVNFNEYGDLDIPVAADIVINARQKERGSVQHSPQGYQAAGYPQGHYPHPPPHFPPHMPPAFPQQAQQHPSHNHFQYNQSIQYPSQVQTPVTPNSASSSANLQQLLANLRQPGEQSQPNSALNERPTPDLAGLLSNVARHQQGQTGQFPPHVPPAQQQQQHGYGGGAPAYGAGQQQPQQNVQSIMDTLARYNR